ncbi:hypothetical protein HOLleu_21555 [Holothuria leucospilota]|uniref:Uncharacterized protein n=1 Tax=Holothuria leucospilota TaxID=206669 RepID=A0A9Q1H6W3_HOLLE|nr:hypothetical protein HOLleu_21555 [Holothuria leucospilota]
MAQFGKLVKMRVPRVRRHSIAFIRKDVGDIPDELWTSAITKEAFSLQLEKADHLKITPHIKERLVETDDLPQ